MANVLEELEKLSVAERLQLVEDLWDSIARSTAEVPIPQWQKDELARRKEIYLRTPESVLTWDQAKCDLLQSTYCSQVDRNSGIVCSVFHCAQDPDKWRERLT
ncbi:MAG: putative addiction module component [Candidatus Hydrogenedentes bacterium ADurb.Bin101]|nr:MAG: putative addiction module component [Candidatus Hydrogenedentes bacterium ADurb.Bin101]